MNLSGQLTTQKSLFHLKATFPNNFDVLLFIVLLLFKSLLFNFKIEGLINYGSFYATLGFTLLPVSFGLIFSPQKRQNFLLLINCLCSLVMLSDLLYFRYYNNVLSLPVLLQIGQANTLGESITSLFKISDSLFVLDLIIIFALNFLNKKSNCLTSKVKFPHILGTFLLGTFLLAFSFSQLQEQMGKDIFTNILDQTFWVNKVGIMNFHLLDCYNFLKDSIGKEKLTAQDKQKLAEWFKEQESNVKQNKYFGLASGKNLIVVQVEALQNFILGLTINGQEVTPNLNELAKRSLLFTNFYYQTAQGNTSDAEFLTNASLFPAKDGAVYFRYPANIYFSLPKILQKKGYETLAFHAYKPSYWNRSSMYQSLGFQKFYSLEDFKEGKTIGWGLSDWDFLSQSADILAEKAKPFYAFLVTLSSHFPYKAFEDYSKLNVFPYESTILGNYLKAVHYTDQAIGNFIKELKEKGLWDDSVVVFYGDHNAFGKTEKDLLANFLNKPADDLTWLTLQQVPLLIHLPQDQLAGVYSGVAGQIDLYPTLANLLGIEAKYLLGQDLLNATENQVVFRDGSFITEKLAFLASKEKLYDLTTRQEVNINDYQELITQAREKLWISDQILQHNLLEDPQKKLAP